jgi:hypothetical protein
MTGFSEISPERPTAEVWEIPRRVWFVLMSWGLAVLVMAGLFSFWVWQTQRDQDRAMCKMIDEVFLTGPEPVPGPAGDRSRAVRLGMLEYRSTLPCGPLRD